MFKILDKFGGEVTANEQAIFNRISTNNSSGYVKGYLNSLGISKLTSNAIGIDSGLLSIQGFRFVNSALITHTVNVTPSQAIAFQLIAVFSHYISSENDTLEIITRPIEELRQENLYGGSNAVYELELARFTMTAAGITDFAATLEQLTYNDQDFTEVLEKVDNAESDSEAALKAANSANSNASAAVNTANSAASTANLAKAASDAATAKVAELSEQIGEKQGTTVKINGVAQASVELTTATVGKSETLTEPFTVGKDTTTATTGYVKFASVSLPSAYRLASARFEVLDKNPVNAQTQMCGVEVVVKNISTTNVNVVPRLLYGSSAYLSKIYACVKKGSYPVLVDLYFDITSSNPQETISCIKPLFTFGRTTVGVEFTFIADNEPVTALPTDTTNTQLSTVYELVTEANTATKALESNNNLLQNGDFTLNTQGQSSYPSGVPYNTDEFVDGWRMIESATRTGSIDVITGGGVTVNATGANFGIRQTLDKSFAGQTITLTIKISEVSGNSTFTANIWNTSHNSNLKNVKVTTSGIYTVTYTVPKTETANLEVYLTFAESLWVDASSVTIDWVKLEEGSISTAPNGLVQNATRALDSAKLNGKAASDIFESDGVTAKKATSLIPDENGAVNPEGRGSGAVGNGSVAIGSGADAYGMNTTAIGKNAIAAADGGVAIGFSAKTNDSYAIAIGRDAKANVTSSLAIGHYATAEGLLSSAVGYRAQTAETDMNTMQLGGSSLSVLRSKVNLTVTSDERDKTDISDITNALAFLEKLNPVTFVSNDRTNYISESDKESENYRKYGMCEYDRIAHAAGTKKGERRRCGLLAQEVIEAMQSVYGTDNYANIVNDNFHDLTEKPSDVENKYTLAYANLVPFLIGAIKELNAKIKELEDRQC